VRGKAWKCVEKGVNRGFLRGNQRGRAKNKGNLRINEVTSCGKRAFAPRKRSKGWGNVEFKAVVKPQGVSSPCGTQHEAGRLRDAPSMCAPLGLSADQPSGPTATPLLAGRISMNDFYGIELGRRKEVCQYYLLFCFFLI
jgi:hypothetical protein